jgi:hypothetical protein
MLYEYLNKTILKIKNRFIFDVLYMYHPSSMNNETDNNFINHHIKVNNTYTCTQLHYYCTVSEDIELFFLYGQYPCLLLEA